MEFKAKSLYPTHPWSTGIPFFLVGEVMGRLVLTLFFKSSPSLLRPILEGLDTK